MRTLFLLPALTLVACGTDAAADGVLEDAPPVSQTTVTAVPCDALTMDEVASALSVPVASIGPSEYMERMGDPDKECGYAIEGEAFEGVHVRADRFDDAGAAASAFEARYKAPTEQEAAEIAERMRDAVVEEGGTAEEGAAIGGGLASTMAATGYVDAPGIGDRASIEIQPPTEALNLPARPRFIHVLHGNVIYTIEPPTTIEFGQSAGASEALNEVLAALGRAVVA